MESVVGRGTLLAGRYRTLQPLPSDLPGASVWDATDQILDRPVRVTVLHAGRVPYALDAARRAALVTDPRLVRVLDVGEHAGVAYTVTEQVNGPSLVDLVARTPLTADQARAVVGEAAAALESARRRGVHHLALRPSVVHLTGDDRVMLTGLAVDGALIGLSASDAAAARADTVGLVALLYTALTGRWPASPALGHTLDTHLPAAPVIEGAPVPPAELASGVPNDLDTLCAVTLGVHDDGPQTPAQLVAELEPWGDIRTTDLFAATDVQPVLPSTPRRPTSPAAADPSGPARVQRTSVRSVFAGHASTGVTRPGTPPPAVPTRAAAFLGPAPGARTDLPTPSDAPTTALPTTGGRGAVQPDPAGAARRDPAGSDRPAGAAVAAPDPATTVATPAVTTALGAAPTADDPAPVAAPRLRKLRPLRPARPAPTPDQVPGADPATGVTQDPGATPAARVTAGGVPAGGVPVGGAAASGGAAVGIAAAGAAQVTRGPASSASSSAASAGAPAAPPPAAPAAPHAPAAPRPPAAAHPTSGAARRAPESPAVDPDERPPLLPLGSRPGGVDVAAARESIAAHRFDPTRLVLLIVGLAIVLGLFAAYRSLTRPVELTAAPGTVATEAPAEEPAGEAPAPEPAEVPAAPAGTPVIASGAQLDPPPAGDENEHPEAVPLAIDGDPSTVWFTRTYNAPDFGGLKDGVGYAVTLAEPATVTSVTLQVRGSGGQVEVRATDPTTPTDGDVLAAGALAPETVLPLSAPTETRSIVLWFTELPRADDGANRLELAEITLS